MITSNRIDPVVLEHLLGHHRDLHSRLLTLRESFATPCGPATNVDDVRGCLATLRERLAEHFAHEEQGGFLEDSISRLPRLAGAVREILAEHPRLLAELDALLDRLPIRDIRPRDWNDAACAFTRFATHLLDHERNENDVLQQGYNEDFGLPH